MELIIKYEELDKPKQPQHIDELSRKCGLFRSQYIYIFNGFACLEQRKEIPCHCTPIDCPLAFEIQEAEWEELGEEGFAFEGDYMIQHTEVKQIK